MNGLAEALERCRAALGIEDEAAIDAPAGVLLRLLGYPVPALFGPHRGAFLDALSKALWAEGAEAGVRAAFEVFAVGAGAGEPGEEGGDDWTGAVAERAWLVPQWLPAGRVTMLTGEGGAGKSRLSLQLCAAVAAGAGRPWLDGPCGGLRPRVAPSGAVAVFATWEDEPDQVARTLQAMGVAAGVGPRLRYVAPRGPLWAPDPSGSRHTSTLGVLTPSGRWLRDYARSRGAVLLVLDPRAAAFGLNENDRSLVRAFMADWDTWARGAGCTVVLIAHPPKGEADYSGSTDWHAASRSVWVLGLADTGTGEPGAGPRSKRESAPAPRLQCVKSSYARRPAALWVSGYPVWASVEPGVAARAWAQLSGPDVPPAFGDDGGGR